MKKMHILLLGVLPILLLLVTCGQDTPTRGGEKLHRSCCPPLIMPT